MYKRQDLYSAVYAHINHEEHGITLNPGHGTGTEEWLNSAFHAGSTHKLLDGEFLQVDIIASKADPVRTSICEDAVVIASAGLRAQLAAQYPAVWARIQARQQAMRETLGIHISDDVLPMSNLNGVYYPFMLDLGTVLALSLIHIFVSSFLPGGLGAKPPFKITRSRTRRGARRMPLGAAMETPHPVRGVGLRRRPRCVSIGVAPCFCRRGLGASE